MLSLARSFNLLPKLKYKDLLFIKLMATFSKILVPHDGGEMSGAAVDEAAKISAVSGGQITLLYVIDERYSPPSTLLSFISEKTSLKDAKTTLRKVLATGVENMLKEVVSKLDRKGLAVNVRVAFGSPADEILKVAEKERFDIIVIGSKSRRGIKRLGTLGSVARKVAESSPIPVMLVR
jgi:nucleotide-binding universal stress UspA family protein